MCPGAQTMPLGPQHPLPSFLGSGRALRYFSLHGGKRPAAPGVWPIIWTLAREKRMPFRWQPRREPQSAASPGLVPFPEFVTIPEDVRLCATHDLHAGVVRPLKPRGKTGGTVAYEKPNRNVGRQGQIPARQKQASKRGSVLGPPISPRLVR